MSLLDSLFGIQRIFVNGVEQITRKAIDLKGSWSVADNPATGRTEIQAPAGEGGGGDFVGPNGGTQHALIRQADNSGKIGQNTGLIATEDGEGGWDLTGIGIPSAGNSAVSRDYADNKDRQKRLLKRSVTVVATTNLTLSGTQTIDGVALQVNDTVLAAGQTNAATRRPYVVAAGAWSPTEDTFDSDSLETGALISISQGTVGNGKIYRLTTEGAINVGVTALTWTELSLGGVGPSPSDANPEAIGAADPGDSADYSRSNHVHAHGDQAGGSLHAVAVAGGAAGFMSGSDKTKLDGVAASAAALTAAAPANVTKAAAAVGVATTAAKADHKHDVTTGVPVAVGAANAEGNATSLARSNHVHAHGDQAGGTLHALCVAGTSHGFMSATQGTQLATAVSHYGSTANPHATTLAQAVTAGSGSAGNQAIGDVTTLDLASTIPQLNLQELAGGATSPPADESRWRLLADGGDLIWQTRNDANSAGSNFLRVHRTGVTVDAITMASGVKFGSENDTLEFSRSGTTRFFGVAYSVGIALYSTNAIAVIYTVDTPASGSGKPIGIQGGSGAGASQIGGAAYLKGGAPGDVGGGWAGGACEFRDYQDKVWAAADTQGFRAGDIAGGNKQLEALADGALVAGTRHYDSALSAHPSTPAGESAQYDLVGHATDPDGRYLRRPSDGATIQLASF